MHKLKNLGVDATLTILIATIAFGVSYTKLTELAERAGYGGAAAAVWPLAVDGLAIVATRGVMTLDRPRYAWVLLITSTLVSVCAGVAQTVFSSGPLLPWIAAGVAAIPPLALLAAPHLVLQLVKQAKAAPAEIPATPEVADSVGSPDDRDPMVAPAEESCDVLTLVAAPEDRRAKALRLVTEDGMSIRSAAREVGVSDTTVRRWLKAEPVAA